MIEKEYDAVVIGGGAAGISALEKIAKAGLKTALIEREESLGGILLQCIHNGFGLHRFKKELTGPEYVEESIELLSKTKPDIYLQTTAINIENENGFKKISAYSSKHGALVLKTKAVVLAMGCRERNRGNISIPGSRVSGIFTAGLAQRLLNIEGYLPGNRVVILGSGDIGLIMARRLTWTGAKVLSVVEIMPHPSGITRNIVQCLDDFDIPLYLSHTISRINGKDRVESVDISPLEDGVPNLDKSFNVKCDTVLLSVGLIPENELSKKIGVEISSNTGGPIVDANMQTSVEGVFACGNVLHVHDLVDFVSEESARCGECVIEYLTDNKRAEQIPTVAGANVKYVTPNKWNPQKNSHFFMRAMITKEKGELTVKQAGEVIYSKKLLHIKPAEMISVTLKNLSPKNNEPVEFAVHALEGK